MSCLKTYKTTLRICDNKLFVEIFNVNPAGVDAAYLTDSLNFRILVGKWDNEHENFRYMCNGDSVVVQKLEQKGATSYMEVAETKAYSIKDLQSK